MRKTSLVSALRAEVRRLAAREVRKALKSLRRVERRLQALKLEARAREKALLKVERKVVRLAARGSARRTVAAGTAVPPVEIRALRARLGLSRVKFARLLAVSPGSIFGWERGTSVPRRDSVARLLALGRRQGRKGPAGTRRPPPARGGRRRGRRRSR
jgi:DNA-binding transcriptional regulator YiaG